MTFFTQRRPKYGEDPNFVPNTTIGEDVTVKGNIKGKNSVMVQGLVFGDIHIEGEVIVTETGYVKGDITSTFAVIGGIVEGNVTLSSYCSLKSTASVTGDITCTAMNMEDGAAFVGACKMIVKSTSHSKMMKRVNEQAAELQQKEIADLPTDVDIHDFIDNDEGFTGEEPFYPAGAAADSAEELSNEDVGALPLGDALANEYLSEDDAFEGGLPGDDFSDEDGELEESIASDDEASDDENGEK